MTKKRAVPEVRFRGFEGEWEERKLLETIDTIIDFRGRTPKKLGFEWSNDGYLALSALNVKDGYIDTAVDAHYGNQDLYEAWMKGNDLHVGQVLFTTEAPMGNVAQVPDDKKYILSQRVIAFNVDQQIIAENFLAVILRVPEVHTRLCSLASGGTAKGVSQRSLAEIKFLIPEYPKEQTRIGELFRNLDARITLEQRKHEKLQNIKKTMLEKMFPKPGAAVPEVRFKGFEGEWEEKKVSKLCSCSLANGVFNNPSKVGMGYKLINVVDMYNGYFIDESNLSLIDISEEIFLKSKVNTGDLFFTRSSLVKSGIAYSNIYLGNSSDVTFDCHLIRFRPNNKMLEPSFANYLLRTNALISQLIALGKTATMTTIGQNDISNVVLSIPNIKEQRIIADFFFSFDTLITLQQKKCEKLQNIKKAMLGKMFV